MSLKIAIAVAVIAAAVVIWTERYPGDFDFFGQLFVVEAVICLLYFLFRKNIDAKFED